MSLEKNCIDWKIETLALLESIETKAPDQIFRRILRKSENIVS